MGNTQSGNSHENLYEQYLNEQKRIIAAQQEQINNLTRNGLNTELSWLDHADENKMYCTLCMKHRWCKSNYDN